MGSPTVAAAAAGCLPGQPNYVGDWAHNGVRISLVKTGDSTTCSHSVILQMVDDPRFHSNPWVDSLAVVVMVSATRSPTVSYQ